LRLGGTDITGSVLASYKTLKKSLNEKVLVFITDAALNTTHPDNDFSASAGRDQRG
jgi:uncharacterized protein with von Willebrand factor type A (vWA) domain